MKHLSISSISVAGKKASPTAMTRVLLVGLALAFPGSAALAGEPIPGVDIYLGKNPGGNPISVPTNKNGAYKFTGLAAGKYDLSVGGQRVQTITVGANQGIAGTLNRESDGTASLRINGQTEVVPIGPAGAPVSTSRSNKKRSDTAKVADSESPLPSNRGVRVAAGDVNGDGRAETLARPGTTGGDTGDHGKRTILNIISGAPTGSADNPIQARDPTGVPTGVVTFRNSEGLRIPENELLRPTDRTITVTPINDAPSISDQAAAGGDGKLAGILRVINNSETDTATVEAINGIGGTGGGRFTFKPTSRGADSANVETSNRDHIDQDAQADIKKQTAVQTGGPIPGIDVKLGSPGGNPGGGNIMATLNSSGATVAAESIASARTDSQGNFHFDKLPAGNYTLILPGLPSQPLTVGADGVAGGKVMRGPDGSVSIFDRWGNSLTAPSLKAGDVKQDTPDQTAGRKAAKSPVGFGSGNNAMGAGPGAGPGMSPPGAAMGGGGPGMSPGPMNPMGSGPMGAGGAMRP